VVLEEGSPNRALYFLRRGCLRVEHDYLSGRIQIARIEPGEIFGEMSFVEEALASASVVAEETSEVDCLDESEFESLLGADPDLAARFYRSLACTLAERLRRRDVSLPLSFSGTY
jgi:CRP-like cAMP-binding protein